MAKRKTLRRQRDKALKELETLKKRIYRIEPQPLRIEQFESRVRIFQAHCDVLELDLEHHFITEEILELNDFVNRNCDNAGFQRLPDELANKHLTLYFEEGVFGVGFPDVSVDKELSVIRNIFYVHQLQQVLRLCGLNELADNFKVRRN